MESEEDERREAAIASTRSLQPDFKPEKTCISQSQLSKFQELHKRRLQIKARSKTKTKMKGRVDVMGKSSLGDKHKVDKSVVEKPSKIDEDTSCSSALCSAGVTFSPQQNTMAAQIISKKRPKLHWGLDTKERWERKSNM